MLTWDTWQLLILELMLKGVECSGIVLLQVGRLLGDLLLLLLLLLLEHVIDL